MNGEAIISQDARNFALITWIGTFFLGFIPGLVLYLTKHDDPYVLDQAKESLNWFITIFVGYLAGILLSTILIGIFVLVAVGLINLIVCILGAVACSRGEPFRAPFAIRLVK